MSLSHRKLSAWYLQLAQQLEAGLSLVRALQATRASGPPGAVIDAMVVTIEAGGRVEDALRVAEKNLPRPDALALAAAAEAGHMPRSLRTLAARHAEIAAAQVRVAFACIYPLGMLHVALVLWPVTRMIDWEKGFQWDARYYALCLGFTLGPLWLLTAAVVILAVGQSPVIFQIGRWLPAIGGYLRKQALADFAFALGNFLEAGVPIGRAWSTAGQISNAPELKKAARAMDQTIIAGAAPGREIGKWSCFPPEFVALYQTGETTGQLEGNLIRLASQIQETANRSLKVATILYPAILFAVIAAGVVATIFRVFAGYLDMLSKLAG